MKELVSSFPVQDQGAISPQRRPKAVLAISVLALAALACTCGLIPSASELLSGVDLPESGELIEAVESAESFAGSASNGTQAGPTATRRPAGSAAGGSPLPALMDEGRITVEDINANEDGQTQGPILTVQITNLETGEVIVDVPCGLIFHPGSDQDQRMMVIQPASAELTGAGSAQVSPYVICIDASKAAPDLGATYQVGVMAEGELLKMAECLCDYELEAGFEQVGVQFAVWAVSGGSSLDAFLSEDRAEGGAADDLFGDELGDMFAELEQLFVAPAQEWLDRCGIELEDN